MRWFAIVLVAGFAAVASAQVPRVLSYQGILTDRDGRILPDGEYRLTIRLYDRLEATEPIYVEEQRVEAVRGVVNALIGTVEPLPARLTFDRVYYVGISVNGSEELRPRTMLTAVPYALRSESAAVADVARALTPEALKGVTVQTRPTGPAGGDLTGTYPYPLIGQGKVTTAKIAGGAVTTEKIADRNVTGAKIHQMGATNGQVLTWVAGTVNNWKPTSPSAWAWVLSGNSISGSEFLGTTNNQPLVVKTNNTERVRVTSGGDVGIGTASPMTRLHVAGGDIRSDGHVLVSNTDNTARQLRLYEPSGSGTNYTAFQAQAQGANIVYTLPGSLAPVATVGVGLLQTDGSGNLSWVDPSSLGAGNAWSLTGNGLTNPSTNFLGTTDAQPLVIRTNNTERLRVTAAGEVGIGTASPTATLDVVGTATISSNASVGGNLIVSGSGSIGSGLTVSGGGATITGNSTVTGTLGVSSNASVGGDLTVTGDATLSGTQVAVPNIPSSSTATEVVVWNSNNLERRSAAGLVSASAWSLTGNSISGSEVLGTTNPQPLRIVTNNTERLRVTAAGEVGIGTASPTATLDVVGTATISSNASVGGNLIVSGSGSIGSGLTVSGGGATITGNSTVTGTLGVSSNASVGGDLTVTGDATLSGTQVAVPNIPSSSTATEVVVWNSNNLERRSAAGLVSANAWSLTGNSISGSEVLGTTNPQPLRIVTNNTERLRVTAAGEVGIGTASPTATLDVVGTATISSNASVGGNLIVSGSGSIGSGLTVSGGGATITGNSTVTGTLGVSSNASVGGDLTVTGDATLSGTQVAVPNIPSSSTATEVVVWNSNNLERRSAAGLVSANAWSLTGNSISGSEVLGTTNPQPLRIVTNNTERLRVTAAGEVGIGTASPTATLDVVGTATISSNASVGGNLIVSGSGSIGSGLTVSGGGATITGNSTVTGTLGVSSNASVGGDLTVTGDATLSGTQVAVPNIPSSSTATEVVVWNSNNLERRSAAGLVSANAWSLTGNSISGSEVLGTTNPQPLRIVTNNTERLRVTAAGEVGIGTASPTATLDVVGTATISSNASVGGNLIVSGSGSIGSGLTVSGGGATITGNSTVTGTLGVSSNASVGGDLTVTGDATLSGTQVAVPNIPSSSTATEVVVWNSNNLERRSAAGLVSASAWSLTGNSISGSEVLGTTNPQPLRIVTNNTERLRVTAAGEVGIGTASPTATLDVVGTATISSNASVGGNLIVSGSGSIGSGLTVSGGGATITGNSTVTGTLGVSSNASVGGDLTVTGDATLSGTQVAVPNIPSSSTATEVVVWNSNNLERRSAAGLVSANAWSLTGNSGTNPSTNFLGTTDAQPLVIRTNNTERLRVTAAGEVGIGTASPTATLDVVGTATISSNASVGGNLIVSGSGSIGSGLTVSGGGATITGNSTVTGTLGVSSNASVGGDLTVTGDATLSGTQVAVPNIPSSSTATEVVVWNSNNLERRSAAGLVSASAWSLTGNSISGSEVLGTTNPQPLRIVTNNTERLRVTAAGEVGIGTASPTATLDVVGTATISSNASVGGNLIVSGSGSIGSGLTVSGGGATITGNSTVTGTLGVSSNASVGGDLTVTGDATLSGTQVAVPNIPSSSTATEVVVWNSNNLERRSAAGLVSASAWSLTGNSISGSEVLGTTNPQPLRIVTNNTERLRVTAAGEVGIGTASPTATLDVVGTATISSNASVGGNLIVSGSGSIGSGLTVSGGGATITGNSTVTGTLGVSSNASVGGDLTVTGDATLSGTQVAVPNIPSSSTATEVVVWNSNNLERRSAAGLVSANAWSLTGNSGTNPSTNFLGTTDAQPLVIRTNNTERLRVTAAGEVGIGTASPTATLDVVGTATISSNASVGGNLIVSGSGSIGSGLTVSGGGATITGNSTVTGTLGVSSNASVGGDLTVTGDATLSGTQVAVPNIPSSSTATEVVVWNSNNLERRSAAGLVSANAWSLTGNSGTNPSTNFLGTTDAQPLVIRTNNTERLRVTAAGEVGIGTASPTATLDVVGTATISSNASVGGNLIVSGSGSIGSGLTVSGGGATITGNSTVTGTLGVSSNASVGGDLTVTGDATLSGTQVAVPNIPSSSTATEVVVWNSNNLERRSAAGLVSANAWSLTGNSGTNPSTNFLGTTDAQPLVIRTNNTERLRVTAAGEVGIGTASPTATLDVVGTATISSNASVGGNLIVSGSGSIGSGLTVSGGGATITGNSTVTGTLGVSSNASVGGDLTVTGDATLSGTQVAVPNIPSSSTATEVVVWNSNNLERRSAAGLVSANAWSLTGNSGTNPSTNFLGTTDAQPLVIRTNNTERLRVTAAGEVGIGTASPTATLDVVGTATISSNASVGGNLIVSGSGSIGSGLTVSGGGATITGNSTVTGTLGVSSNASVGGDLTVTGDATLSGTQVAVPNIPSSSTATEVVVWNSNNLERRSAAGLVSANAWSLTGNSGTNPSTNFLGTTDAQPLVIRVDNQETFRFNAPGAAGPGWSLQRGGGNTRGLHAVDLQSDRTAATQVASGDYSVISGGWQNTASGTYSTVGGGYLNTASGTYSTVGGGGWNTASGLYSTVGGGGNNIASGQYSTVGGGGSNTAGQYSTVGGGYLNTASGQYSTVGGGGSNTAGQFSTVGGGFGNTASGPYSTVGGGFGNTASGDYSVVLGGYSNTANASYNLVFGREVDPTVTESYRVYFFGDNSASPSRPSGFLVINRLDGNFPIHVGTDNTNGNGAYLTTGGTWTNGSSRSFKERFVQYNPQEVLQKILTLPVEGYYYKGTEEYHITPMAEDFYAAFGTGVHEIIETDSSGKLVRRPNPEVNKYLSAADVAGVAILGIQALAERVDAVPGDVGALRQENAQLKARVDQLEQQNVQQQAEIVQLSRQNAELQRRLERLEGLVEQLGGGSRGAGSVEGWLGDNIPNPHDGTTVIPYYVPTGVGSAELVIEDGAGRRVLGFVLSERGVSGQVVVRMEQLSSGRYEYRLLFDGRVVGSKAMQLVR